MTSQKAAGLVGSEVLLYPVQRTWSQAENVSSDELNINIRDAANWMLSPPRAYVYSSVPLTIPTFVSDSNIAPVTFNTVIADTDQIWSPDFPTRFYVNTPGLYKCRINIGWPYDATIATYFIGIAKNSSGMWPNFAATNRLNYDSRTGVNNSSFSTHHMCTVSVPLVVGEYIEFFASQTTGADAVLFGSSFYTAGSVRLTGQS